MKKYLFISLSVMAICALILGFQNKDAIARQFNLRVVPNSTINNATSTSATLRYVAQNATTTIQFSTHNQVQVSVLVQAFASSTPNTAVYEIEYGIETPVPNSNDVTIDWFKRAVPINGPELGHVHVASSTLLMSNTLYASTTPLLLKPIQSAATTSDLYVLSTFGAQYMRIRASLQGSGGTFWISPLVRDDIGN